MNLQHVNCRGPVLITAGPTYEALDSVRFLGNRSSGQMGVAIAEAACRMGLEVMLLLGPNCATPDADVAKMKVERFRSTSDLELLLNQHWPSQAMTLIMAAAVADFRLPEDQRQASSNDGKIKRSGAGLTLELESTPDLVAACSKRKRPNQRIIGFALERADELNSRASEKLKRKGLDAIVANPLETMDATDVTGTLCWADGKTTTPGPCTKVEFAEWLVGTLFSG